MKILCDIKLMNLAKTFAFSDFQVNGLNESVLSAFDTFDATDPELFVVHESSITNSVMKCVAEKPALKIVIVGEGENKEKFKNRLGNVFNELYIDAYTPDPLLYCGGVYQEKYASDLICIENMQYPEFDKNIKFRIFSDVPVDHLCYSGSLVEAEVKHVYKSAKYVLTEKNSENAFLSESFPVNTFSKTMLNSRDDSFIKENKARILEGENLFTIASKIISDFGYEKESKRILNKLENFK